MPSTQTITSDHAATQRNFFGYLLILCIIVSSLGSVAIIVGSFTHINIKGVPVVKVIGGVFLIIGAALSIAFGITLIRIPSLPTPDNSSSIATRNDGHALSNAVTELPKGKNEPAMPNAHAVTVYNSSAQRRSLRHLLTLCIFICFLGLIAIIVGSFTPANVQGIPVIKIAGGVFLIVGIVLSIGSGAALIRLPSYSTQIVTRAQYTANQRQSRNGNSIGQADISNTLDPFCEIYLDAFPYDANLPSYSPPPFEEPPSYEEATRQRLETI